MLHCWIVLLKLEIREPKIVLELSFLWIYYFSFFESLDGIFNFILSVEAYSKIKESLVTLILS